VFDLDAFNSACKPCHFEEVLITLIILSCTVVRLHNNQPDGKLSLVILDNIQKVTIVEYMIILAFCLLIMYHKSNERRHNHSVSIHSHSDFARECKKQQRYRERHGHQRMNCRRSQVPEKSIKITGESS
jgi:hypothetical protein